MPPDRGPDPRRVMHPKGTKMVWYSRPDTHEMELGHDMSNKQAGEALGYMVGKYRVGKPSDVRFEHPTS